MNDFIKMVMSRGSVRQFTGGPVDAADLETIVRAGMAAPSACNVQPWAFIIVTDRNLMDNLAKKLPYARMLDKAGAAVVVCGVPDRDESFARKFWPFDCSAATQNILLAAHALGYGAVWTAVFPEEDRVEAVRHECGIPGNIIPLNVIPIGIPAAPARPKDKYRPENVHWNTWGDRSAK